MSSCVVGLSSKIGVGYASKYHFGGDVVIRFEKAIDNMFHDEYLICTGYLEGEKITSHAANPFKTFLINYIRIAKFLDKLFDVNRSARVCVIGSMSGIKGSYDMAYAGAKAALHLYVKTKQLSAHQHLTCVAPTIIWDTNMTQDRIDKADLKVLAMARKNGRWLSSSEVAETARAAINNDTFCNQIVEMR